MTPKFISRHLFRTLLAFTALLSVRGESSAANPASASAEKAAPVALVREGLSPSFNAVASRLELGGHSFDYSEANAPRALASFLDEIIKALPERERRGMPPGFTVTKLFQIFGLDSVAAYGSSSRARTDGSFHSRTFVHTPKGRKGVFTLSGGPAEKLMLLDFAPKDTDLALEFPIHFNEIARDVLPGILELMPPSERADFEREISAPNTPMGMSAKQIMEKLDARAGIYLRLDPSQKFQPEPGAPELPGVDGVIVIERLGWLMEALKPELMPKLMDPRAPVTVTENGDILTVRFKGPAGPPPMDFQPVFQFDSKSDRILIASRPAMLDAVISGKQKITQGADFAQAWRDLPEQGNACIYTSSRFLQTFSGIFMQAATMTANRAGGTADARFHLFQKLSEFLKPLLSRGQVVIIANQPDGILVLSNASIPMGSSTMGVVSTTAILSSVALPAFTRAKMVAQAHAVEVNDLATLRQVGLALKMYSLDNGKYPAALAQLAPKYIDNAALLKFTDRNTGHTERRIPWMYQSSLTEKSPGDEILLAAPLAGPDGKRAVGFNDGSVRSIPEAEFQKLWSRK